MKAKPPTIHTATIGRYVSPASGWPKASMMNGERLAEGQHDERHGEHAEDKDQNFSAVQSPRR